MSRQLPVPFRNEPDGRSLAIPDGQSVASSPLVRLAIALTPDVLRAAERVVLRHAGRQSAQQSATQTLPSRSIQLSEVEFDLATPFVRRITVRSATAWSTLPVEAPPSRSGLRKVGRAIGMSGALALVAGVMVRRMMPDAQDKIIDISSGWRD
ncbi:hypothetical protein BH24CHL1_BH24CHL1_16980 [soil metagenome]|jgi:hypothetical protein